MSEQLTNTGVSGLLAMLGAAPAATGQGGATPAGSALPFGAIMQAQGAGFNPLQLDANGQTLPQSGGVLPPSGEMLAQMQAQIDAKTRAPELSQLLAESPDPDLRAALLKDNQSLRDGVVMESQWPGVLPESTELSLDSPEVVALMQNAFEGHDDAQQRLSEAMGALQPPPQLPNTNAASMSEMQPQVEPEGENDVVLAPQDLLQAAEGEEIPAPVAGVDTVPEPMPGQVVGAEADAKALQQDADAMGKTVPQPIEQSPIATPGLSPESRNPELSGLPDPREPIPRENVVNTRQQSDEQVVAQEALNNERTAAQAAATQQAGENPVVGSQSAVAVAAVAMRENQPVRNTDNSPRAAVSDAVAGLTSAKDSSNSSAAATQLTTPGQTQVTPATTQVTPGQVLKQDSIQPEGRSNTAADIATAARQESADSDAPAGAEDGAEGWLRAETRAANQATTVVDNLSRMTLSQAAFTLAGKGQMGSPAWNQALSERVMVMTAQNNQVAEIQLDPPELGSLKVRLQVGQDQVSVSFTSPHASVRDAVEQSMPRLREMMEEQGLNLGESSVNDQSSDSGEDEGRQRFASQGNAEGASGTEDAVSTTVSGEAVSLVDYYA
ncbi:flagellar hook-length control protein FliK [Pontibacterium sp.]|uniref:flagellar hook-length control protein FliK n=1 Tax=Pontibacterium sp. TaxID=2036026 RepID=UPI00351286C0